MLENKKAIRYLGSAFALLCAVSLYRQLSIRSLPNDTARPFIVYAVCLLLVLCWLYTLNRRITQKTMLFFLQAETAVMLFWLIVRFLQDSMFFRDVHIMRISGYYIAIPLLMIPMLGVYSSLCLGMGDSFRFRRTWYLILIPDLAAILLLLTNESHHLMCKVYPAEQENLYFHANYGLIFPVAMSVSLIILRILIIYQKTRKIPQKTCYKAIPLIISVAMPSVLLQYLFQGFLVRFELIELTGKLYFLEILSWESCIMLGLVPVNTQYRTVFERSTVGMRIVNEAGETAVQSEYAKDLSAEQLEALKQNSVITDSAGIELHMHRIRNGFLIYQQDVSQLYETISELNRTAEELKLESALLQKEFRTKSEEAAVSAKNRIYDQISEEVGSRLSFMTELLSHTDTEPRETILKKLCIIGTYVKRRCNLRLIEQGTGSIDMNELYLSLRDYVNCLNHVGISADLYWNPQKLYPAGYAIAILDSLETEMEKHGFMLSAIRIHIDEKAQFMIRLPLDEEAYSISLPESQCCQGTKSEVNRICSEQKK